MGERSQIRILLLAAGILIKGAIGISSGIADDQQVPERTFQAADSDANGKVTNEEYLNGVDEVQRSTFMKSFNERDADANGLLSESEYAADPMLPNAFLEKFRGHDLDKSAFLSEAEYVDPAGEEFYEAAKYEFSTFDANSDQQLIYEEFLFTPRSEMPAESRLQRLDVNADGSVDREEFHRRYSEAVRQSAGRFAFCKIDLNGDRIISREEYLLPPEQQRLRLRGEFAFRDLDDDDRLSRAEYFTPFLGGQWEEAAKKEAEIFDADNDGFLTYLEFATTPTGQNFPDDWFVLLDENQDQFVTAEEFLRAYTGSQRTAMRIQFYNRDANTDLKLSLAEFKTPLTEVRSRLEGEYTARDSNEDHKLSAEEYYTQFIGGEWEKAARSESVQFDLDKDGFLSMLEFSLSPAGANYPEDAFKLLDIDADHRLTLSEYVKIRPQQYWIQFAATFHRRDGNHDGVLEFREAKATTEPAITDPVAELANQVIAKIAASWEEIDKNRDEKLDSKEWGVGPESTGAAKDFAFTHWDLNADRMLTQGEIQQVIRASYGLCRLDGKPLRLANGLAINWAYINALDRNRENVISREEFLKANSSDAGASSRFSELDQDQNGQLDDVELIDQHFFALDLIGDFCRIDADIDGRLSHQEVIASAQPWQKELCKYLVADYDQDGDGSLSLKEYLRTPFANPVIEWYHGYQDLDHDGQLSWQEFKERAGPGERPYVTPQFVNIMRDVFDHIDSDHSGKLAHNEFHFNVDLDRIPVEAAYEVLDDDGNGSLSIADATGVERPKSDDPVLILQWEERTMQIEEALGNADSNSDGSLTLEEFKPSRAVVSAALRGYPPARNIVVSSRRGAETNDSGEIGNTRFLILITLNVLLLIGIGWFVLRKA